MLPSSSACRRVLYTALHLHVGEGDILPGWGSSENLVWGCGCQTSKSWLLLIYFCPLTTHQYTNFVQKSPNFGAFSDNLLKIENTPNLYNSGTFVSTENPVIAISTFTKKHPMHKVDTYTYTVSLREPHSINDSLRLKVYKDCAIVKGEILAILLYWWEGFHHRGKCLYINQLTHTFQLLFLTSSSTTNSSL